jgi:hypothetical protein
MYNHRINGHFQRSDVNDYLFNLELEPGKFLSSDEDIIHLEEIPKNATILHRTAPLKAIMGYGVVVGLPQALAGVPGRLIFIPED